MYSVVVKSLSVTPAGSNPAIGPQRDMGQSMIKLLTIKK